MYIPVTLGVPCAAPEVCNIVDTSNIKPEHRVQSVVQADRNQQSVEEAVDTSADCAQLMIASPKETRAL